jgi:RNA polymerase sigma factor (sigma-70 family)
MDPIARVVFLLKAVLREEQYRELTSVDLLSRYLTVSDEAAFRVLVKRHGGMVLRTARPVVGCDAHADEVFQQTFLHLVAAARAGRAPNSVGRWLGRTAYRVALNVARRESRARRREERAAVAEAQPAQPLVAETLWGVRSAVAKLPDRYRRAIELVYFDGLTHAEAAEVLGRPKGTIDSLVSRALVRLSAPLQRIGPAAVVLGMATGAEAVPSRCVAATMSAVTAGVAPAVLRGWPVGWVAAIALLGLSGVGVSLGIARTSAGFPQPTDDPAGPVRVRGVEVAPPAAPSLQQVNRRRATDIAAKVEAAIQGIARGKGALKLVGVDAFDTRVRIRFAGQLWVLIRHPRTRLDLVYDTENGDYNVYIDYAADGKWRWVNPGRPIVLGTFFGKDLTIPLPALGEAYKVLATIPADPRAEADVAADVAKLRERFAALDGMWRDPKSGGMIRFRAGPTCLNTGIIRGGEYHVFHTQWRAFRPIPDAEYERAFVTSYPRLENGAPVFEGTRLDGPHHDPHAHLREAR